MFGLFEKLQDSENASRERAAFIVALLLTGAIGTAWFYFSKNPLVGASYVAENANAISTPTDDVIGPFSRFRAEMADAAVFLANQVRNISGLWKEFQFGSPVEFQREEDETP